MSLSGALTLGFAARDPEQAAERMLLSIAIDHAYNRTHLDWTLNVDQVERDELALASFDDGLSW